MSSSGAGAGLLGRANSLNRDPLRAALLEEAGACLGWFTPQRFSIKRLSPFLVVLNEGTMSFPRCLCTRQGLCPGGAGWRAAGRGLGVGGAACAGGRGGVLWQQGGPSTPPPNPPTVLSFRGMRVANT